MKLTPRLNLISELVSKGSKIADIGTDHGYIPISLLMNKKIEYAILSDINKGPLENANKEVIRNNMKDMTSLRLGSGLETINVGEVDEVIIAGMGGILISEIIEKKYDLSKKFNKLILQPMQASEELRKYLFDKNFEILDECFVREEHRIYEVIVAKYNKNQSKTKYNSLEQYKKHLKLLYCNYVENTNKNNNIDKVLDDIYYEVTPVMLSNKNILLFQFIDNKINECNTILSKINQVNSVNIQDRKNYLITKKILLDLMIKYY